MATTVGHRIHTHWVPEYVAWYGYEHERIGQLLGTRTTAWLSDVRWYPSLAAPHGGTDDAVL